MKTAEPRGSEGSGEGCSGRPGRACTGWMRPSIDSTTGARDGGAPGRHAAAARAAAAAAAAAPPPPPAGSKKAQRRSTCGGRVGGARASALSLKQALAAVGRRASSHPNITRPSYILHTKSLKKAIPKCVLVIHVSHLEGRAADDDAEVGPPPLDLRAQESKEGARAGPPISAVWPAPHPPLHCLLGRAPS
jgi:hypothetical protein